MISTRLEAIYVLCQLSPNLRLQTLMYQVLLVSELLETAGCIWTKPSPGLFLCVIALVVSFSFADSFRGLGCFCFFFPSG